MVPDNKIPEIEHTSDKDVDFATTISTPDIPDRDFDTRETGRNYEITRPQDWELVEWFQAHPIRTELKTLHRISHLR